MSCLLSSMMIYRLLYPVGQHTCDVTSMLVLIVLSNQLFMQLSSNSLFKVTSEVFSFPTVTNNKVKMLPQAIFFTCNTWLWSSTIPQYAYLVCPYLNWSSFKSGFWAFRYLLIVSSSLGMGSLKEGEQRDMHFMSNGTNEASVSYTVVPLCLHSFLSLLIPHIIQMAQKLLVEEEKKGNRWTYIITA